MLALGEANNAHHLQNAMYSKAFASLHEHSSLTNGFVCDILPAASIEWKNQLHCLMALG